MKGSVLVLAVMEDVGDFYLCSGQEVNGTWTCIINTTMYDMQLSPTL